MGGSIHIWDDASLKTQTIYTSVPGDISSVMMSDDGQVVTFTRRGVDFNQCVGASALWVIGRDGGNPREMISAEQLGGTLGDTDCEYPAIAIAQMEWLPETHRLAFSVMVDGEHTSPQGLYLADADTLSVTPLVSTDYSGRFVISPDGQQVAFMSTTGLSFINTDGSNWRQDVFTYPKAGSPIPGFANGVWTQDSRAFLLAAYGDNGLNIAQIPLDGSAMQLLATDINTNRESVAFSPNGLHVGFVDGAHQSSNALFDLPWVIQQPGTAGAGPLAIPARTDFGTPANLHWSPANVAYVYVGGNLFPFCPNAAPDYDICDSVTPGYVSFYIIQWLDAERFLFLTREPSVLFLGALDHTTLPIVVWPLEESVTPQSFSAVLLTPHP
jgi:dipeptidyl aminopeptidase/acylaminoacyl peptidase